MFLTEEEVRRVVRKRLIAEATDATEVTKDIGSGVAAGLGTATALTVGAAASPTFAAATMGSTGLAALAGESMIGLTAANIWNPVGWSIIAGVAVGTGLYFLFGDADGNKVVERVLSSPGNPIFTDTQKLLSDIEQGLAKDNPDAIPAGGLKHEPIPDSEIEAYVEKLYAATKGRFMGTGMGTDEEAIRKVFNEIPTLMDVALVSKYFQEDYSDAWTFDSNLYNVMINELSDSDFNKYVTRPLDPAKKPLLTLGGKTYTLDQLKQWGKDIEKAKKEAKDTLTLIDPNSLKGNFVKRIQHIMNLYAVQKELGKNIAEDGAWGPKTEEMFNVFLNHVSNNHSIFKDDDAFKNFKQGEHSWKAVSAATVGKYPGYTSNTKGCLAFVTDGYNDNIDYGTGKKKIAGSSGGGKTSGGGKKVRKVEDQAAGVVGAGLVPSVRVTLAGPGKDTLESIGFPANTSTELASTVATRVKGTITGGVINLTVVSDRNGRIKSVRVAPGQRRNPINRQFENLRNVVRRYLEKAGNVDNTLIEPSRSKRNKFNPNRKSRKFELVLDFPAGTY
jgi:hypothetical protein